MSKIAHYLNGKRVYPSKWVLRMVCNDCNYIFNDLSNYYICPKCGNQHNTFKNIKRVYDHWLPFYRNLIEVQIKD